MILQEDEEWLAHYGVKGMKWGVRKERTPGVSRKTDRDARKDSRESADAKMYYGDGAGTRRKLIKAKVESKRKANADYGKAYDFHSERQDLGKSADRASSKRKRTDRAITTKRSAGYVARKFTGEMGTAAAFTAVAIAGVTYMNSPSAQAFVSRKFNDVKRSKNNRASKQGAAYLADYFKRNGAASTAYRILQVKEDGG